MLATKYFQNIKGSSLIYIETNSIFDNDMTLFECSYSIENSNNLLKMTFRETSEGLELYGIQIF